MPEQENKKIYFPVKLPPEHKKGLVSIIMSVMKRQDLTEVCLDSLKRYTPEVYELIIIRQGNEIDLDLLKRYLPKKIIQNEKSDGYPSAINQGMEFAEGEYIMFLNNDVVCTPNWLGEMLKAFQMNSEVGLVGPTFSETGGVQNIDYNRKGVDYTWVDEIKGVCMLTKREVVNKIGGLDTRFSQGGGDDNDWSMRVKLAGYKTVIARKSFIYHYNSATFRDLFDNDVAYSKKYASGVFYKFREKWKKQKELGYRPRVFIAIPASDGFVHAELAIRLVEWSHDNEFGITIRFYPHMFPLDNARNQAVKDFMEDYWDYLLFIDNDIVPPMNALRELIAADKDIIAPVCFTFHNDDNGLPFPMTVAHRYDENKQYKPYYGKGVEETDVVTGGMFLVKRPVYEKMDRPFAFTYHANGTVIYSEDFYFSQQAQKLGYKLFTHYGLVCRHFRQVDVKGINDLMCKYGK